MCVLSLGRSCKQIVLTISAFASASHLLANRYESFFHTGLFLFLFSHFLSAAEPMRTWTSSDGRTLEARFIEQVEQCKDKD